MNEQFDWEKQRDQERRGAYTPQRNQGQYETAYYDNSFKAKLFSFSGRLNRLAYFVRVLVTSIICCAIIGSAAILAGATGGLLLIPAILVIVVVGVASFIINISLVVRRLHDLNLSGLWYLGILALGMIGGSITRSNPQSALSNILTLVVVIIQLLLLFWPGTKGPNKFGADPIDRFGGRIV